MVERLLQAMETEKNTVLYFDKEENIINMMY